MKLTLSIFVLSLSIAFGAIAQGNEAMIEQLGLQNSATSFQGGENNSFTLHQVGSHETTIEQAGADNTATVQQWAGVQNSEPGVSAAFLEQTGTGNEISISQYGEHVTDIEQSGSQNSIDLTQAQSNSTVSSLGEEYGSGAFALLMQHGFSNDIVLAQNGSHYAEITQNGSQNTANVMQDGLDLSHLARIEQDGSGNDATIEQYGSQSSAVIRQHGNGHSAHIQQAGYGNQTTVIQN